MGGQVTWWVIGLGLLFLVVFIVRSLLKTQDCGCDQCRSLGG
jgi:hypothetical protein